MIDPIPDAASNHPFGLVLNVVPVLGEVADGVPHGMGIFTKEIWLLGAILVLGFHLRERRIHSGINVGDTVHPLVMDRTVVKAAYSVPLRHDIRAWSGLVTKGPYYHRRVKTVSSDHPFGPVDIGFLP